MRMQKVIRKRLRHDGDGGKQRINADVNAAVSANVGERHATSTSVRSRQRIVQRSEPTKGEAQ